MPSIAKIAIGASFTCPVTHFFSNGETLLVVLYGLFKIAESMPSIAKIAIGAPFKLFFRKIAKARFTFP